MKRDEGAEACRVGSNGVPQFPYSAEAVASIAVHFLNETTTEWEACQRAIKLLDAASGTIRGKTIAHWIDYEAEQARAQMPEWSPFAKGVRLITRRRTETEAVKAFRNYLRLFGRLSAAGFPGRQFTKSQLKALFASLPEGRAKEAEDAQIEASMVEYRRTGFSQRRLAGMREGHEYLETVLLRPIRNSEKGKRGGRPRGSKKNGKKSLAASTALRNAT